VQVHLKDVPRVNRAEKKAENLVLNYLQRDIPLPESEIGKTWIGNGKGLVDVECEQSPDLMGRVNFWRDDR
jgi:hypothetical protein